MIHVKKFIDKVTYTENKRSKDIVMSIEDARGLRDELSKMLADNYDLLKGTTQNQPVIKVEMSGGKW
jgi:5-bromo-4-chloroindolyl phosphate hydrolysis protein